MIPTPNRFTRCEIDAAIGLRNQAAAAVCFYAEPQDRECATIAVLLAALNLADYEAEAAQAELVAICPKCKEPINEIADCNSATCPTMRAFNSWWLASKYMQVVYSDKNTRQIALDGWTAARKGTAA